MKSLYEDDHIFVLNQEFIDIDITRLHIFTQFSLLEGYIDILGWEIITRPQLYKFLLGTTREEEGDEK